MSAFGKKLRLCSDGWYGHWCPGCKEAHVIAVGTPYPGTGAKWGFNGNAEKPTFTPSINIVGQCHYFITDGQIQFCTDSRHALAGQTVELPDWPLEGWQDWDW